MNLSKNSKDFFKHLTLGGELVWTWEEMIAQVQAFKIFLIQEFAREGLPAKVFYKGKPSPETYVIVRGLWELEILIEFLPPSLPEAALVKLRKEVPTIWLFHTDQALNVPLSLLIERTGKFFLLNQQALVGTQHASQNKTKVSNPSYLDGLKLEKTLIQIQTSGTTHFPKPAFFSLDCFVESALASQARYEISQESAWWWNLPLNHVSGLSILFRMLFHQGLLVTKEPDVREEVVLEAVTHVSFVSTQLKKILAHDERAPPTLKVVLLGGGYFPNSVLRKALALKYPLYLSYGLTEFSSQVATSPVTEALLKDDPPFLEPLPGYQVQLSPEQEIRIKGPSRFKGHGLREEGSTEAKTTFWNTRDLGELDERGWVRIKGRLDNVINSGGEKIQAEELEQALQKLLNLDRVLVTKIADEIFGERIAAFLKRLAEPLDLELVRKQLKEHLPPYQIPAQLFLWPEEFDLYSKVPKIVVSNFLKDATKL